jgi:hypothetical protein
MKMNGSCVSVRFAFLAFVSLALMLASAPSGAQVSVTTWHNDKGRTGQNTSETVLTPGDVTQHTVGTVTTETFGLLCKFTLSNIYSGWSYNVYGQPLVVAKTDRSMTVYVVTMDDEAIAFGIPSGWAGNCSQTGTLPITITANSLIQPAGGEWPTDVCQVGGKLGATIYPTIGILGTPVIDTNSNTMYLDTYSQQGGSRCNGQSGTFCPGFQNGKCVLDLPSAWYHKLHALDLTPGGNFLKEKTSYHSPVTVSGAAGFATFVARKQIQRPGLLWLSSSESGQGNPMVYAAYSMMDGAAGGPGSDPNGFIFGYDAADLSAPPLIYSPTPGLRADGGGIWEGGAGLAFGQDSASGSNYIYFPTGNGVFDLNNVGGTNGPDAGDSFVKVTTSLQLPSSGTPYFTPSDQYYRWCNDQDYGSGGALLVPDGTLSHNPYLAINAEKLGNIWIMDRGGPGGFSLGACDNQNSGKTCSQETSDCTGQNNGVLQSLTGTNWHFHTAPAYWSGTGAANDFGYLYYIGSSQPKLTQFPLCNSATAPICAGPYAQNNIGFVSGATPSVSSYNNTNGIVWAIWNDGTDGNCNPSCSAPGILYAFGAVASSGTLTKLYDSSEFCNGVDQPGPATKFSVPIVANGYVFIGTQTDFDIYGVVQPRSCN